MPSEYRVVRMVELFRWPARMQSFNAYEEGLAAGLAEALNRMSAEGWEYVGVYAYQQDVGPGYAIFRRDAPR
jgi:hypothetical protein